MDSPFTLPVYPVVHAAIAVYRVAERSASWTTVCADGQSKVGEGLLQISSNIEPWLKNDFFKISLL